MDNYQAIAYAKMALYQLQKEGKEVTTTSLSGKMIYLMDMNSETEIEKKASNLDL